MDVIDRIGSCGIVPVVVLDNAADAIPTANALLAGGIDVMEITFRTAAAAAAIAAVSENVPGMLVGAGTVLDTAQTRAALAAGAKFIVSPGYAQAQVDFCVESGVPIVPGCVTPAEIMSAIRSGLSVLKFFPANVYGGLAGMKALSAPFPGIRFLPTGGVNADNLPEYAASSFIHAVGGSWLCAKSDIAAGNFTKMTALCRAAVERLHSFTFAHVGLNSMDEADAALAADAFGRGFFADVKSGSSSIFAGQQIEVMKTPFRGKQGHLAFFANNIERALVYLEKQGFTPDARTAKYKGGRLSVIYLNEEIGGFAIHLIAR